MAGSGERSCGPRRLHPGSVETIRNGLYWYVTKRRSFVERYFPAAAQRGTVEYEDIDMMNLEQAEAARVLLEEGLTHWQSKSRKLRALAASPFRDRSSNEDPNLDCRIQIRRHMEALKDLCGVYGLSNPALDPWQSTNRTPRSAQWAGLSYFFPWEPSSKLVQGFEFTRIETTGIAFLADSGNERGAIILSTAAEGLHHAVRSRCPGDDWRWWRSLLLHLPPAETVQCLNLVPRESSRYPGECSHPSRLAVPAAPAGAWRMPRAQCPHRAPRHPRRPARASRAPSLLQMPFATPGSTTQSNEIC